MKALLVLAAVLVGLWLWRNRNGSNRVASTNKATEPAPQDMLRCRHCGLHLPASDTIAGAQGSYCCSEHLRLSEP